MMCTFRSPVAIQTLSPAVLLLAMLAAPVASDDSPAEQPALILSSAPAAPPESAEARIALRQHRESAALNRFTFPGNVLEGTGDLVEHWIVMFCPGWHDKCQGLLPSYELLGVQWENKLNKALMSSSVRFAKVDCATEKALCVSLDIDDYPSVVHYQNQKRVASWHGGAPGLVRFVKQELEPAKQRPRRSTAAKSEARAKAQGSCAVDVEGSTNKVPEGSQGQLAVLLHWVRFASSPWRPLCFALMLMAAARCIWQVAATILGSKLSNAQSTSRGVAHQRVPSNSLQACLPQEWARERRPIDL